MSLNCVCKLSPLLIEPAVRAALLEDLGRAGDLTSDSVIPADTRAKVAIVARRPGCVAGLDLALTAFRLLDPNVAFEVLLDDGELVKTGQTVAKVTGAAREILTAERVALNYLCHLSGIASETSRIVEAVAGYKTKIACTRKTTPGQRAFEKYAVRVGGGVNHRFGLDDGILIKDNHIAIAGGIATAVKRAQESVGHMMKVEVEVDTLAQLNEALACKVDAVLLDNMDIDTLEEAVRVIDGRAIAEASGGITIENAPDIAASGVDLISIGWLTHSAPILDFGLDFLGAPAA